MLKSNHYTVHRIDNEDGSISYEVIDERADTYRIVCTINDHEHIERCISAKKEAEMIARGLNLMIDLKVQG